MVGSFLQDPDDETTTSAMDLQRALQQHHASLQNEGGAS